MKKPIKILHAPTTVGGNPQGLSRAEKGLGLDSVAVSIYQNYLQYKCDVVLESKIKFITYLKIIYWAFYKSLKFDVIHFNFGSSFLPLRVNPRGKFKILRYFANLILKHVEFLDLKIAHVLGKKIFITFQGDDIRQGDFCKKQYPIHFVHHIDFNYYSDITDQWKRDRISILKRYTSAMFALNPDLLQVLPPNAEFLPYSHVDLSHWKYIGTQQGEEFIPHIIHAPTNRAVKGTDIILKVLERLSAENIPYKFTLVEGLSNDEARKLFEKADLLIDQLYYGFYGGLAVELMSLGKPVICYLRKDDLHLMPAEMVSDLPIIQSSPEELYEVLKNWLTVKKKDLCQQGIRSRSFVEKWHDPNKIAEKMKEKYLKSLGY